MRIKMDSSEAIYNGLKDAGINFIVSVPCVNLSKLLNLIDEDKEITHTSKIGRASCRERV